VASSIFKLGVVGGCASHVPCTCGGILAVCPNTWIICTAEDCTGAVIAGATVVVKDSGGTTVGTCTTVLSAGIPCSPCDIPRSGLYFSWTNTIIGNGSGTLAYNAAVPEWKYTAAGGGSTTYGPKYASSCVDGGGGTFAWTSPGNAKVNDGIYASASTSNLQATNFLDWTSFGFPTIPTGVAIDGIKLEVACYATSTSITDSGVYLIKSGTRTATNKSASTPLALALAVLTYGGPTDKWGTTWTAADWNSSTSGASWSAVQSAFATKTVYVDYAKLTIYASGIGWTAVLACVSGTMQLTVTAASGTYTPSMTSHNCSTMTATHTASGGLSTTDGFGTFRYAGTPTPPSACCTISLASAGTYTATVSATGYVTQSKTTTTICNNSYKSTILLPSPIATVKVTTCMLPVPGASVTITDPLGGTATYTTDSIGQFTFPILLTGVYGYSVGAGAFGHCTLAKTGSQSLNVYGCAGQTITINLPLDTSCWCCPCPVDTLLPFYVTGPGGTVTLTFFPAGHPGYWYGSATSGGVYYYSFHCLQTLYWAFSDNTTGALLCSGDSTSLGVPITTSCNPPAYTYSVPRYFQGGSTYCGPYTFTVTQ
jgi:hypothetical protein